MMWRDTPAKMDSWQQVSWFSPILPSAVIEQGNVRRTSTFRRLWQGFATARVALGLVMLVVAAVTMWRVEHPLGDWLPVLCLLYLLAALAVRLWYQPRFSQHRMDAQWLPLVAIDVLAVTGLYELQLGGLNYTPLLAFPVLMAAVLGSRLMALATPAAITLALLALAWRGALGQAGREAAAQQLSQAGLTGLMLFVVALFVQHLVVRLSREELAARLGRAEAQTQAMVNELVIEHLSDGVLVADGRGLVRAANPAARRLLGDDQPAPAAPFSLNQLSAWQPLAELVRLTCASAQTQYTELTLLHPGATAVQMQARTQLTPPLAGQSAPLCVVFMQDLRETEARLRTEKLAAMGRMSAAVAHEIRNPLAAIAQANELLDEELADPAQKQLTTMIGQNTRRLSHIVDDILDIARVRKTRPAPLTDRLRLDATVEICVGEWQQHNYCGQRLALDLQAASAQVYFSGEHFRRVLVNLLDNALRYASASPAAIQIVTRRLSSGAYILSVWSDGAPIERSVQRHLFEPFFSSESRSTGLGLYMCRELCERHQSHIGYERKLRLRGAEEVQGNEFFVSFHHPASAGAGAT